MGIQKIGRANSSVHKSSNSSNGKGKQMEDNPALGADSGDDSDDSDLTELSCERCLVDGKLCSVPYELFDLPDLKEILSLETWNSCLTEEERFHLSAYLPDMDHQTFCLTLKEIFDGSNVFFGNPMDTFFKRLRGGFYPPKVARLREGLLFLQRRKFYHSLRSYHDRMGQLFMEMRRLWDQCDMGHGVEERVSMWTRNRKQKGIGLLDLNKFPRDDHLSNEELNSGSRGAKAVETKRSKDILPSLSLNGVRCVAQNFRPKGLVKMKASEIGHNPKLVTSDISDQYQSVPKGVLKIAPKVPSVPMEQSELVPRGALPNFVGRSQGLQDFKLSSLPASLYFQDANSLYGSPFLRHQVDGSRLHSTLNQPWYLLNQQESITGTFDNSESSTRNIKRGIAYSNEPSVLGEQLLLGDRIGRGSSKLYESSLNPIGARRYAFVGENSWPNLGGGTEDFSLRSLEAYPFGIPYARAKQRMGPMTEEHSTMYPRVPDDFPRISDVCNAKQQLTAASSSDQVKVENDVRARKSEMLSKSSLTARFKDEHMLPLTYKRRKALAKVNSSDVGKPLTAEVCNTERIKSTFW